MFGRLGGALAALGIVALGTVGLGRPAGAAELILGAYGHDVSFIGKVVGSGSANREGGADIELGVRSDRIEALHVIGAPQAHALLSLNTNNTSNFVAAGLSWPMRLTDRFYFRPGLGLAYTDGEAGLPPVNAPGLTPQEVQRRLHLYRTRIDFGSQVLFEPELNLGMKLGGPWSAELSWVHISNGQVFHHGKNQGLDDAGLRVIYALGARGR
ncbi:acyloxyacyl hydrolase [Phenylobacterium soli]|uniref:Acyloxyacyl hydrolase n=1 Tax=Phenylobacterium soli TaxID=2170551 RepID=A0A328AJL9_9CAUL|nr:acyloxyacyl hydrolase [Phenylobacterium soli]RAK53068.1 acyloxyacyl hydrolase [Phenylobacterium soli]